ncbi:Hsp20/alpha crystallin family protein [Priestia filamentosa]|uniref:Uncharacterized protein n=1 Tax=Priestia filamentosa TaxID=1402861 RepID=A0A1X7DAQ2_9BACI|nr:Hsp20/alpha crystallin family protein [Priestia filamentosa]AKO93643.1 hypothetical protein BEH_17100 [Priestia filamentosa]MDT3763858.1 Hsp20/alpha crystallin family protein [Priestia filamentosa]OXS71659.1 hypothetical protein B1B01_04910 [Priestia filamentosa]RJS67295.1 Hsp20/alpha crystallin family protein [Priestia filamentosa]WCM14506.1 Hsp20/alpha crystallin family protein [Priestia filamentosa]
MKKENAHNESELSDDFNAWVDYVFSHPFLHYVEQNYARIDLFETEQHYIIEAELIGYEREDISLLLEEDALKLSAFHSLSNEQKIEQIIDFPFSLQEREIRAVFHKSILEIFIAKTRTDFTLSSHIPITSR